MRIFVSYSFREQNAWIEKYVVPMIGYFGHTPVNGKILEGIGLSDDVKQRIRGCRSSVCFVTRDTPVYDQQGQLRHYTPPPWVQDELTFARGIGIRSIECRETEVNIGGMALSAAPIRFSRDHLEDLLLNLAEWLRDVPVGPLLLRLSVPPELQNQFDLGALAGTLRAVCIVRDGGVVESYREELPVLKQGEQLVVPLWVKVDPDAAIDVVITYDPQTRLACRGVPAAVCLARLQLI